MMSDKLNNKRVLVGMSGGVDSTATCLMLLEQGYDVVGVTMRTWDNPASFSIPDQEEPDYIVEARALAARLGIEHHVADEREDFRRVIVQHFMDEYLQGRTPNPCVMCNPLFKFRVLKERADRLGCAYVATGHYSQLLEVDGYTYIIIGNDAKKDQSYFLFGLREEQLSFSRFPLGAMTKEEVRKMVTELGLPNASDPESQDICFASPELPVGELLRQTFHGEITPGVFTDMNGNTLGKHAGIHLYTPGQRKGTGVALGKPAYVRRIIPAEAKVELVTDQSFLMSSGLRFHGLVVHGTLPPSPFRALVQIRYRSLPVPAEITCKEDGTGVIRFETPVRAVTPGQAAVIYDEDRQIAGGWITDILP